MRVPGLIMVSSLKDLVEDRLSNTGVLAPSFLHSVSVRIDPGYVPEIDLLVRYLGYKNRSALLREVIENSIDDLTVEVAKHLQNDPEISEKFKKDFHAAMRRNKG